MLSQGRFGIILKSDEKCYRIFLTTVHFEIILIVLESVKLGKMMSKINDTPLFIVEVGIFFLIL